MAGTVNEDTEVVLGNMNQLSITTSDSSRVAHCKLLVHVRVQGHTYGKWVTTISARDG